MPMGITGIAGLRLFLMWLKNFGSFTSYSAKARLGGIGYLYALSCMQNDALQLAEGRFYFNVVVLAMIWFQCDQ
ncbi:hypothetical protein BK134_14330 [Paenibacillus peoriae]|nr:hypothetical protein PPYC2_11945 [Paenibacillus polymyxa]OME72865.1 hypothetical protein BK119_07400 [Paenibacillus peoriae]OMF31505.1 hypothetical protein BK134_14330 [Paenibacillus peoriae]POR25519.1 hypothetical protein CG775_21590 [Paenibacillus polymyxa]